AGTFDVSVGYVDDRFQFTTDDPLTGPDEQKTVPDVTYQAVRIGGRGSLLIGRLEAYIAAEDRLGATGRRPPQRPPPGRAGHGGRAALGAALHLGHFDIRAEGSVSVYSWSFRHDTTDVDQAESGSDAIEQIGLTVGYVY